MLDLSRVLAGPVCSMLLGDLGADVIKVERPPSGDDTRGWGPPFAPDGTTAYFRSVNRNKLSVAADLDSPADRELLGRLIAAADVVLDNFLPGTLERRGLDPKRFLDERPRLVWCTITGFDERSRRPGYDFVIQAESGWMSITGEPEGEPMKTGAALADVMAGKDAAVSILGLLLAIERGASLSAAQRRIHVSLLRSAVASLVNVAQNTLVTGADAPRWGNAHPNLVPYQLFHAADRPIVLAVGNDAQWLAACSALGLDDLGSDPALGTNAGRVAARARVVGAIAARVAGRPATHWLGRLGAAGVPCGVVRSVAEALADVDASPVTGVGPATPGTVRWPPPRLDEHGRLVRELGWEAFARMGGAAGSGV